AARTILDAWRRGAFDVLAGLIGVGWSLFRYRFAQRIHAIFDAGRAPVERILFPDAELLDGTPVEIKRPWETDSFPGQRKAYARPARGACASRSTARAAGTHAPDGKESADEPRPSARQLG